MVIRIRLEKYIHLVMHDKIYGIRKFKINLTVLFLIVPAYTMKYNFIDQATQVSNRAFTKASDDRM